MKRIFAMLLALALVLSICPAALAAGEILTGYTDVAAGAYYAEYLRELTELGAVAPVDGKFNPNAPCTRAEFVTWLWKTAGAPVDSGAFSANGRGKTSLTAGDVAKLQEVTIAQTCGEDMDFVNSVYGRLGIDLSPAYANAETPVNIFVEIFERVDDASVNHERDYVYTGEKNHPVDCMLVEGGWGPRDPAGGASWPVAGDHATEVKELSLLQPGDVLILADYEKSGRGYTTCVYQGGGRFLMHQKYTRDIIGPKGFAAQGNAYGTLDFSGGADAVTGYTYTELLETDFRTGNDWEFYFVLRPAQGVYNIHDPELDLGESKMTDVDPAAEYAPAVAWAEKIGVTTGKSDGTFGVDDTVTRAQMVTFLYRYALHRGYDHVTKAADISGFADVAALPSHSKTSMPWGVAIGMVQGNTDNALMPNRLATRAHAAAFIGRLLAASRGTLP